MALKLRVSATQTTHQEGERQDELMRADGGNKAPRACRDQQLLLRQCGYPPSLAGTDTLVGRKRQRVTEPRLRDLLEREQRQRPVVRPLVRMRRQRAQREEATPAHTRSLQIEGVSRLGSPTLQRVETPTELGSWLHSALVPSDPAADAVDATKHPAFFPEVPSIRRLLRLAAHPELSEPSLQAEQSQIQNGKEALVRPEPPSPGFATDTPTGESSQASPSSFDSMDEPACMGALLRASLDPQRAQRLQACGAVPYLVEKLRETTNPQVATQIAATLVNLDPAVIPVPGLVQALGKKLSLLTSECSERLMVYMLGDATRPALSRVEIDTLARQALATLPRHLVLLRRLAESSAGPAGGHATFWNEIAIQQIEKFKPATAAHAEHTLAIISTMPAARMQQRRAALANHLVVNIAARFPEHNTIQRAAVALLAKIAAA
ncbi:hypothetical protein CCYA_CCYA12G3244 [Cyanidiococcus yangmingshanensis]|nr:hypothetical protein CCYA_CCYA12G3244 [Cyanidiococcus yangmingshanensis]